MNGTGFSSIVLVYSSPKKSVDWPGLIYNVVLKTVPVDYVSLKSANKKEFLDLLAVSVFKIMGDCWPTK